jgi:Pentapeptide repeats (8 copies)
MKCEIRSRWNADILFAVEAESFRSAVELAIKRGVNLRDANLSEMNLCNADLRGADLRNANLEDADLRGANLSGANLENADLSGANLRDANLGNNRIFSIYGHTDPLVYVNGALQIGCERHTLAEWREKYRQIGKQNGYSALDTEIYKLHIEHIAAVVAALCLEEKEPEK